MPTKVEELASSIHFQVDARNIKLADLKRTWGALAYGGYSAGTVARAYHIVKEKQMENGDILADMGKPAPVDDYSIDYPSDEEEPAIIIEPDNQVALDVPAAPKHPDDPDREEHEAMGCAIVEVIPQDTSLFAGTGEVLDMDRDEALHKLSAIRGGIMRLSDQVAEFHDRKGWHALGYKNWDDCVKAEFDTSSRSHIFYLARVGGIRKSLEAHFKPIELAKLKDKHIAALAELKEPEKQAEALTLAFARAASSTYRGKASIHNGKLTEKLVQEVVSELRCATLTERAEKAGKAAEKPVERANGSGGEQSSTKTPVASREPAQSAKAVATQPAAPAQTFASGPASIDLPQSDDIDVLEVLNMDCDGIHLTVVAVDDFGAKYSVRLSVRAIKQVMI